jgi:hypothetical protein
VTVNRYLFFSLFPASSASVHSIHSPHSPTHSLHTTLSTLHAHTQTLHSTLPCPEPCALVSYPLLSHSLVHAEDCPLHQESRRSSSLTAAITHTLTHTLTHTITHSKICLHPYSHIHSRIPSTSHVVHFLLNGRK